ncbi:hypothetical protein ACRALDRAFT_2026580 [Sodiomyces alcalophilus JCM 7366]|uniref:uncharacterized protein n=1 Tax=Sodiomyces alcalophilus JCM 7366 TaxID=591952 RepID=UPI0039B6DD0D
MTLQDLPLDKHVTDLLQKQNPTRVAVFLRKKSPLYSLENDEVLVKACCTLGIDPVASRAELMTIYKWDRLTIFVFNIWYNDYDWATAHHKVDLPVILVDYGKRMSSVKICSQNFRDEVNHFVARQHELHGWDAKAPYLQDHTLLGVVPTYPNPRCVKLVGPDGIARRQGSKENLRAAAPPILKEGGTATLEERVQWSRDLVDIGGRNILLDADRNIRLYDFAGSSLDDVPPTFIAQDGFCHPDNDGAIGGTLRAEIHALGSAIFEIMTSICPHWREEEEEIGRAVDLMRYGVYPDVAGVVLGHIIAACWRGEYASAQEVTDTIAEEQERCRQNSSHHLDDHKLVIRVPATGWADGMTDDAARALESKVTTLRLLATKTSVPVPKVIAFNTTYNNDIKAPYLYISFVPGKSVSKAWFKTTGPTSLEERRLRILKTLSGCIAQLSRFRFQKIGSLHSMEDGSLVIGPCYDYHKNNDGTLRVVASGPFDTAASYLKEHRAKANTKSVWGISASKLTNAMIPYLPAYDSTEGFVLCPPDFDSQNIMVDDEGNITGIIDWDHVQTLPQCVGYSIYPSWITRDWNPLMYGWPKLADSEDSPQELERLEIYRKLVQTAIGADSDAMDILYDLGTGCLSETDWSTLKIYTSRPSQYHLSLYTVLLYDAVRWKSQPSLLNRA